MSSDFVIRRAAVADGEAVGEIHAESWAVAYKSFFGADFFTQALAHRRAKWHAVLAETAHAAQGRDRVLLASKDGHPLAFSYFGASPDRPGWAEIFGFYNHPSGWGTGVAATLMAATLSALREDGYRHAHLWTLRDTSQSRRFYTKTGFTASGGNRQHDFGDGTLIDQVEYEMAL
ncbi:GNAT family N-acetyltransferase [Nonomuraea sp. NPDC005983]|uniref:GNAT family N-acetyltransferase n=1 Tax=Nonomuraea sp. NPDC005983 TaxID=3155595 RepID=UPI0033BA5ACD